MGVLNQGTYRIKFQNHHWALRCPENVESHCITLARLKVSECWVTTIPIEAIAHHIKIGRVALLYILRIFTPSQVKLMYYLTKPVVCGTRGSRRLDADCSTGWRPMERDILPEYFSYPSLSIVMMRVVMRWLHFILPGPWLIPSSAKLISTSAIYMEVAPRSPSSTCYP